MVELWICGGTRTGNSEKELCILLHEYIIYTTEIAKNERTNELKNVVLKSEWIF